MGGRLLEGQDLDEEVVHAEVIPITFERRIADEIIQVQVVFELRVKLMGSEIQKPAEELKRGQSSKDLDPGNIMQLNGEARGLVRRGR